MSDEVDDENERQVSRQESADEASANEANEKKKANETHTRCFLWMSSHHLGWLARIPGEWPRTISLIFGVVIPLFVLIAVSLFFGYGLAQLEAPSEVDANNELFASRAIAHTATRFHGNVTRELPRLCLEIAAKNQTANMTDALKEGMDAIFFRVLDFYTQNKSDIATVNETSSYLADALPENITTHEFVEFMVKCGETASDIANSFAPLRTEREYTGESPTFNWIRCDDMGGNVSGSLANLADQILGLPLVNRTLLKPDVQEAIALAQWRQQVQTLFNQHLEMLILDNETSAVDARILSFWYAVEEASGFDHCFPNSAAGAWFWFTVMTTIGYGNTTPASQGGQAMIYTLGFLSILLFAIILGAAGKIVVTIWDDFIDRTRLGYLNIPWVSCIFWGFCYYAWMLVIAAVIQNWKAKRLGEDMLFSEAYWFSYISTTTVGLGDYYLEHEVILREDLFVFPIMLLTGFVLLANFFVKLTEVVGNLIPRNQPTLEETLATSDVPCLPKISQEKLLKHISRTTRRSKRTERDADSDKNGHDTNDTERREASDEKAGVGDEELATLMGIDRGDVAELAAGMAIDDKADKTSDEEVDGAISDVEVAKEVEARSDNGTAEAAAANASLASMMEINNGWTGVVSGLVDSSGRGSPVQERGEP